MPHACLGGGISVREARCMIWDVREGRCITYTCNYKSLPCTYALFGKSPARYVLHPVS